MIRYKFSFCFFYILLQQQTMLSFSLQSFFILIPVMSCSLSDKAFELQGGRFKNTYELLNLRALKFSPVNKIHMFQCTGKIFCVEFQRYPLKLHTKYFPYTERYDFYTTLQFWELLDLRAHTRFWNTPRKFIWKWQPFFRPQCVKPHV